jgi:drug/metabolite transporter (DMT)-like permease
MICAGPTGNVVLGAGMKRLGPVALWPLPALLHNGVTVFTSPTIWIGIGLLIAFFVSYMLALSWADFSFVRAVACLAYAVVAFLSVFVLKEHIPPLRWAGIAVIGLGVFVVSRTAPKTTPRKPLESAARA